jgi:hypothetical protein
MSEYEKVHTPHHIPFSSCHRPLQMSTLTRSNRETRTSHLRSRSCCMGNDVAYQYGSRIGKRSQVSVRCSNGLGSVPGRDDSPYPPHSIGKTEQVYRLILHQYQHILYQLPVFAAVFNGTAPHSIAGWPTKNGLCGNITKHESTSTPLKTPHLPQLTRFLSAARVRQFTWSQVVQNEQSWNSLSSTFETVMSPVERTKMTRKEYQRRKQNWLVGLGSSHNLAHEICRRRDFAVWNTMGGTRDVRCVKCAALYPFEIEEDEQALDNRTKQIVPVGQYCESLSTEHLYHGGGD